jgi:hypothetical protein
VERALAKLIRRVRDVLGDLGPGGYLLPSGAVKTNYLESACNEAAALIASRQSTSGNQDGGKP